MTNNDEYYVTLVDEVIDEQFDDEPEQPEFDDDNAEYWQTYGEAEMRAEQAEWEWEAQMAYYDDDPNPYHGDYSEM